MISWVRKWDTSDAAVLEHMKIHECRQLKSNLQMIKMKNIKEKTTKALPGRNVNV